jgi:hypothetical protein
MPWHCPACNSVIRHNEFEAAPRPHAHYRCHVCRLELMVDERTAKLAVAPLADGDTDHRDRPTK